MDSISDDLPTLSEATALLWIEDLARRIERIEHLIDNVVFELARKSE